MKLVPENMDLLIVYTERYRNAKSLDFVKSFSLKTIPSAL